MLNQEDPSASTSRNRLALAVALALMLLWGSNYSVQKAVMAQIGPGALVFMRYLVTPACAIALLLWQYGLRWPGLNRRDWVSLAGLAALGHVAHVNVMTQAMHLSTPFSSALISALGPMFTLLMVCMLHSERFARIQVAGLVLAMAGVLVFLSDKLALVRTQGVGDPLLLFATLLFSANTVTATRLFSRHGVTLVMAYSTLMATGPMLLINAPQALLVPWASLPAAIWGPCSGRWRSLRSRAGRPGAGSTTTWVCRAPRPCSICSRLWRASSRGWHWASLSAASRLPVR